MEHLSKLTQDEQLYWQEGQVDVPDSKNKPEEHEQLLLTSAVTPLQAVQYDELVQEEHSTGQGEQDVELT